MSGRVVYIAGPMTGYPQFNYGEFHNAEEHLRLLGYDPLNPARGPGGMTWENYMRRGVANVLRANAVFLLPGWEASRGACLEVHVAHALGLPTIPRGAWSRDTLPGWAA